MRHVSQVEVLNANIKSSPLIVGYSKKNAALRLGEQIGEHVAFTETDKDVREDFPSTVFKIEVEAFSYDDWVSFKNKLNLHLKSELGAEYYNLSFMSKIGKMINELESKTIKINQPKDGMV